MSRHSEEAKQILESEVFHYIVDQVRETYVNQIVQNPIECIEATMGLKVLADLVNGLESLSFDNKMHDYNEANKRKYQ